MRSKTQGVLHLLFSIERVEVVVIGELSTTGDLPKSEKANPVNSIHRPTRQKLHHVSNTSVGQQYSKEPVTKK